MAGIPNSADILQAVIDATPDAIFVKDLDGRYVLINEAAARFLAKMPADIIGKNDFELYPEETARRFVEDDRRVLERGTPQAFEGVATGEGGAQQAYLVTKGVYRDKNGQILGLFGISHDITELQRAQQTLDETREALFHSQKMEAVGQLTGGIAHDFNNILAVILGNVELLKLTLGPLTQDERCAEFIEIVARAVTHGKDLTSQLLAFSRRRQLRPQATDVDALVTHIVRLLARTLGSAIHITTAAGEAGAALVDPQAFEAAVLNIALNARDAMPDGGSLTLRTSRTTVDDGRDDLASGDYVVLAIEDTGAGMPAETLARVFEPFFTTKGAVGTGLGLSMVHAFAKQSGGAIRIASTPGRGTVVTLLLPASENAPLPADDAAPVRAAGVSRTILVVEDEADVRHTVRRQLETLGHRVLIAEGPTEALLLVTGAASPDVLLTDVLLGAGMDGIALAESARKIRPALPVIFMSGHAAVRDAQERMRKTGAPLLGKPFTSAQLERALQTVFQ